MQKVVLFVAVLCLTLMIASVRSDDIDLISPLETYKYLLNDNNNTFLVDVRTDAEWTWVGLPTLQNNTFSQQSHYIQESLLIFPDMHMNEQFGVNVLNKLKERKFFDVNKSRVITMCCCGGRSKRAADLLKNEMKVQNVFSMMYGFNGDLNQVGHRQSVNGWVFDKLPWRQN